MSGMMCYAGVRRGQLALIALKIKWTTMLIKMCLKQLERNQRLESDNLFYPIISQFIPGMNRN